MPFKIQNAPFKHDAARDDSLNSAATFIPTSQTSCCLHIEF